jgi:hypothetical protein
MALLSAVREGTIDLIQPPHWLAEVAAVLARLSPHTVDDDVADLYAMEFARPRYAWRVLERM